MADFDPEAALRRMATAVDQASAELSRAMAQSRAVGGRRWRRFKGLQKDGAGEARRAAAALRSTAANADLGWMKAAAAEAIRARPVGTVAAAAAIGLILGMLASR